MPMPNDQRLCIQPKRGHTADKCQLLALIDLMASKTYNAQILLTPDNTSSLMKVGNKKSFSFCVQMTDKRIYVNTERCQQLSRYVSAF